MLAMPSRPGDVVCLTFDVDWAPDPILEDVLSLVDAAGMPATFYATHRSELLKALDGEGTHEVGLHPHAEDSVRECAATMVKLKEHYPGAVGARSHGTFVTSSLLQHYEDQGLIYEANQFLLFHEDLHPTPRRERLLSVPCYWSDDNPFVLSRPLVLDELGLDRPGLKIFNFHPIHIFMNTRSRADYRSWKEHDQEVEYLREHADRDRRGIRVVFRELLDYLDRKRVGVTTVAELSRDWWRRYDEMISGNVP